MKQAEQEETFSIKPAVVGGLIVLSLWGANWLLQLWILGNWSDRGTFGDMFGSVNALFTGFAFAGIIYTTHLQRQELRLQREELSLQRQELTRSADAQTASEKRLAQQAQALEQSALLSASSTRIGAYTKQLEWLQEKLKRWSYDHGVYESAEELNQHIEEVERRRDQLVAELDALLAEARRRREAP